MKTTNLYGIRSKITKKVWTSARGKYFWTGIGNSKNAFIMQCGRHSNYVSKGYFDHPECKYEVYLLGRLVWEPVG